MIGRAAVRSLATNGWEVVAVSRSGTLPDGLAELGVESVSADRADDAQLRAALGAGADVVVDTVAFTREHGEQLNGLAGLVGSLVVISSASVYADDEGRALDGEGEPPILPVPIPETQRTAEPGDATYSTRKAELEQTLRNLARVLADPTLLAVPASAPWKTLQEFVDDAKKRPGQIPYGSSGPYGTLHVAMEMFAASAGIKLLHVPFRGAGPALTALLSGTVQAMASAPGTLKQQVDDGKMRVLANWGAERVKSFPDLPTFRELGYKDVEFYIWAGLFAQTALPAPIMTRLREAMAEAVKAPEVVKTFETAGSPVAYQDAPEFSKFVAEDSARLVAAVKKIGKVE